jgi:hypothetical protein
MTKEELKDLVVRSYFACDTNHVHPEGLYPAEEIDLLEFSQRLIELHFKQTIEKITDRANTESPTPQAQQESQ